MKKVYLLISLAIFAGFMFQSCSKDDDNGILNFLPEANVVLTDGDSAMDEINMGTVVGTKVRDLLLITGTKILGESEKKLLVYVKGNSDGAYPVNISANSLLSFDLDKINSSTVIYYVSKEEYYLLVKGEITLENTEQRMTSGTFSGQVIPAHGLKGLSLETIQSLYDGDIAIDGNLRAYSIKF